MKARSRSVCSKTKKVPRYHLCPLVSTPIIVVFTGFVWGLTEVGDWGYTTGHHSLCLTLRMSPLSSKSKSCSQLLGSNDSSLLVSQCGITVLQCSCSRTNQLSYEKKSCKSWLGQQRGMKGQIPSTKKVRTGRLWALWWSGTSCQRNPKPQSQQLL